MCRMLELFYRRTPLDQYLYRAENLIPIPDKRKVITENQILTSAISKYVVWTTYWTLKDRSNLLGCL